MRKLKNISRLLESINEETSVEDQFLSDLKRAIEYIADADKRLPSRTYKPSSMNCMRQSYYQLKGVTPDKNTSVYTSVGITNSGTDTHVRIQSYIDRMKDIGMDCEYVDVAEFVKERGLDYLDVKDKTIAETKLFHKDLNLSFMCDGIIKYKGKYYILELKTEIVQKWEYRTSVDPKHYAQATAYSVALGLDDVLFIYINRNNLDMKAYMFHVTDTMKQDLLGYITNCDTYVATNTVPPKTSFTSACTYCQYKNKCKNDD